MKNLLALKKIRVIIGLGSLLAFFSSCQPDTHNIPAKVEAQGSVKANSGPPTDSIVADVATILQRPEVPILCYHQLRDWTASDSKRAKDYIVPLNNFREQLKLLADSGYHTILPDQLYDYLVKGTELPSKPVMLTFDDNKEDHFTIAREEMKKYSFKGVFFIMTVSLNRPHYMTTEQIRQLYDEGNIIASHTWDHGNVKTYGTPGDWEKQVDKPSQQLEKITGKRSAYFAYPFGLWDRNAIEQLKQRGYKAAFQLSAKRDEEYPLFTIRRMIVPGEWNANTMLKWMHKNF